MTRRSLRPGRYAIAGLLIVLGWLAPAADAQLPAARLYSIFPAGGRRGDTVGVVIGGADLEAVRELRFSHPGIKARPKMKPASKKDGPKTPPVVVPNTFEVSIDSSVPPGTYEARAVGAYGVSTPQAFVVGVVPELNEKEPNDDRSQAEEIPLGHVVNGRSDRQGDVDYYRFEAHRGQRLLIECHALRIDSHFRPVMTLYDADGKVLQVYDRTTFDALLDFVPPRDGTYVLQVHDLLYGRVRVGGPRGHHFYRLTIHHGPHIDFIFPPAGRRGARGTFALYGRNLPGGKPDPRVIVDGRPLDRLDVPIELPDKMPPSATIDIFERHRLGTLVAAPSASMEGVLYRPPMPGGQVANPVFVGFATADVVVEVEPNDRPDEAQPLSLPCEVAGQFTPVGDRDWFVFQANQGEVYEIEVLAQRLGVPVDAFLVVQQIKKDGSAVDVAEVDDQRLSGVVPGALKNVGRYAFNTNTDDPAVRFTAPATGTYRIMVRDLYHELRGDPRFIYRLSIRRPQPDFRLAAAAHYPQDLGPQNRNCEPWSILLRRGGTERIDVLAFRWDGFDGDIDVHVEGLPKGVSCSGTIFRPGQTTAALILQAADDAPPWNGPIRIVGKAKVGDTVRERTAAATTVIILGRTARFEPQSRRALETIVSVSAEPAPLLVTLGDANVVDVHLGETVSVPVTVVRRGEFKGPVQLIPVVLPANVSSKVVTITAGKSSGSVAITANAKALQGAHRVVFEAKIDVPYRRAGTSAKKPPRKLAARIPTTSLPIRVLPKPKSP